MIGIHIFSLALAAGCLLLPSGCGTRQMASTTPPAPSVPIQTTSADEHMVPAGTVLAIRTNDSIQTDTAGQTYSAEVAREIVSQDNKVLIPEGSDAELVVVSADRGGTVGTAEILLAVRSLTVDGRTLTVESSESARRGEQGLGTNRRTATMVGGGAVLGTVIGAIAGGGRGAAIGAAAGATGGAATQILTRGKEVKVPAETLLSFRLQQPLRLGG